MFPTLKHTRHNINLIHYKNQSSTHINFHLKVVYAYKPISNNYFLIFSTCKAIQPDYRKQSIAILSLGHTAHTQMLS